MEHGVCGISLSDALHCRVRKLRGRDETVFEGRGPSVSIRLEVRNHHIFSGTKANELIDVPIVAWLSPMEPPDPDERF